MTVDAEARITNVIKDVYKDFEKRINQRLDFILRECGLDGILGVGGDCSINGKVVHPHVYACFLALNQRAVKAEEESRKLKEKFLRETLA